MTNDERLVICLEARTAEFERAIEERFKPALRTAIGDVCTEFLDGLSDDEFATIREAGE